jgi:hypothetical protein
MSDVVGLAANEVAKVSGPEPKRDVWFLVTIGAIALAEVAAVSAWLLL